MNLAVCKYDISLAISIIRPRSVISYGHITSDEMVVMVEEKKWWEEEIRGIFCDFSVKYSYIFTNTCTLFK